MGEIHGTIRDQYQRPMALTLIAILAAANAQVSCRTVTTDEDGAFQITLPPGTYAIFVFAPRQQVKLNVGVTAEKVTTLVIPVFVP